MWLLQKSQKGLLAKGKQALYLNLGFKISPIFFHLDFNYRSWILTKSAKQQLGSRTITAGRELHPAPEDEPVI
jgi:hypothetical protein